MIQLSPLRSFPVQEFLLTRLAFSPSGETIAVGHKDFRTFDTETGEARSDFRFGEFVAQLRYSSDGRYLAACNVGDNHPATRGKVAVFDAASGRELWSAAAAAPVEACAFHDGSLFWNSPQAGEATLAGARIEPHAPLSAIPVGGLDLRALAATPSGFVCFGRESAGAVRQVEGADLVFRKFRLRTLGPGGELRRDVDLGIGAGVAALSPDGKLLAAEMVDFKNNERHVSLIDTETGIEANLLALEANTLPVFEFSLGSEYFLCLKEDAEASFNRLRIWRTSDLKLVGEAELDLSYHAMAACLEHSTLAFLGAGKLDLFTLE